MKTRHQLCQSGDQIFIKQISNTCKVCNNNCDKIIAIRYVYMSAIPIHKEQLLTYPTGC